jgi:hypothetical protein
LEFCDLQEKCADYLPPSEVLDCHRLFGDFHVTLKKREERDKYVISTIQLKVKITQIQINSSETPEMQKSDSLFFLSRFCSFPILKKLVH